MYNKNLLKNKVDEKEIIQFYLSKPMALQKVSENFGICVPSVKNILKKHNIDIYTKNQISNPKLNELFFEHINTEETAYFLGLILTDGCIFEPKTNNRQSSISLTLKSQDAYIIEKFKHCINTSTQLSFDKRGCVNLAFRSNKIALDLKKYGVVPNKSFSTFLPHLDENMMPHLLRGILDGDGNICSHVKQNNKHMHQISYCGSNTLIEQIKEYLESKLNVNNRKIYYYPSYAQISYNSIKDVLKIGNFLYDNATLFLIRKKEKFLNFKNHYSL